MDFPFARFDFANRLFSVYVVLALIGFRFWLLVATAMEENDRQNNR